MPQPQTILLVSEIVLEELSRRKEYQKLVKTLRLLQHQHKRIIITTLPDQWLTQQEVDLDNARISIVDKTVLELAHSRKRHFRKMLYT